MTSATRGSRLSRWNLTGIRDNLQRVFGITWDDTDDQIRDFARSDIERRMFSEAVRSSEKQEQMGEAAFEEVARWLLLRLTDDLWKDHLLAIDRLRQSVGLRGYGQRNPLLEYKRKPSMFLMMTAMRDEMVLTQLLRAQLSPKEAAQPQLQSPAAGGPVPPGDSCCGRSELPRCASVARGCRGATGRAACAGRRGPRIRGGTRHPSHEPRPCGSGLKFKKCCGKGVKG